MRRLTTTSPCFKNPLGFPKRLISNLSRKSSVSIGAFPIISMIFMMPMEKTSKSRRAITKLRRLLSLVLRRSQSIKNWSLLDQDLHKCTSVKKELSWGNSKEMHKSGSKRLRKRKLGKRLPRRKLKRYQMILMTMPEVLSKRMTKMKYSSDNFPIFLVSIK